MEAINRNTKHNSVVFDARTVVLRDQFENFIGQCTMRFEGNEVVYENFVDKNGQPLDLKDGEEIVVSFPPSLHLQ